jgi:hypothetical protein
MTYVHYLSRVYSVKLVNPPLEETQTQHNLEFSESDQSNGVQSVNALQYTAVEGILYLF